MIKGLGGALLVASPLLVDPNFYRSVVLVCNHGDDGTLGVILNRPSQADAGLFLPDWSEHLTPPGVVFEGGPVQRDTAVALGRLAAAPGTGEWMPVAHGAGLLDISAGPDGLSEIVDLRIFSGYAGWGNGQLEGEVGQGDWFVVESLATDLFAVDASGLWRRVLRRQRGRLAMFAAYPDDVGSN